MALSEQQVTIDIAGGPTVAVGWTEGMNAQDALERAWDSINSTEKFTYGLQFYGHPLGYMVFMINETFDSFVSTSAPFFYWHFYINDVPATAGIDNTVLRADDRLTFAFEQYVPEQHKSTLLHAKYNFQTLNKLK